MNTKSTASPDVSVIMPAFNAERYIEESISSVINQTFNEWELIIVNDNSTDKTQEIIDRYKYDKRIISVSNKNCLGAAKSRNKAINLSQGTYIAFLDSDDIWDESKLEIQLKFMNENNIKFSFSSYRVIDEEGSIIGHRYAPISQGYNDLLKHNKIGCLTSIFKRDCLAKEDLFMPEIKMRQDYALWLKILREVKIAHGLDMCLASYRDHSNSLSANKIKAILYTWQVYRKIENLNLILSLYYFINNVSINIFLKIKNKIFQNKYAD